MITANVLTILAALIILATKLRPPLRHPLIIITALRLAPLSALQARDWV